VAIEFDGPNKRINLTTGTITLNVVDLWSRWVDWVATDDNSKYLPAFSTTGGDDIDVSAGTSIPIYAFLQNGWRVKPQEASHTLSVPGGILLVEGGGDPFVNTNGSYVIRINYSQPVQAITVATGGSTSNAAGVMRNTAFNNFQFLMVSSTNHITPATGLTVSGQYLLDGGDWTALTNAVVEVGNGIYRVNLTAAELDGEIVTLRFTALNADARYITIVTT